MVSLTVDGHRIILRRSTFLLFIPTLSVSLEVDIDQKINVPLSVSTVHFECYIKKG